MTLNACKTCGAPAEEQIRREHHKDDPAIEMHDYVANDFRVACTQCPNATGWNHSPAANPAIGFTDGMAKAARDHIMAEQRDAWNAYNPI